MKQQVDKSPKASSLTACITTMLLCLVATIAHLMSYRTVASFAEVYSVYGDRLPWLTRSVIAFADSYLVLALISIGIVFLWLSLSARAALTTVAGINFWLSGVGVILTLVAVYLPVFF